MERQVVLKNASGMHARPASLFVTEASKFTCDVFIEVDGKRINAKSILGLLTLGIPQGKTITIITEGADSAQALDKLCQFVEEGMGEL